MRKHHRGPEVAETSEVLRILGVLSKQAQKTSNERVRQILLEAHAELSKFILNPAEDNQFSKRAA